MVSDRIACESGAVFNCKKVFIHIVDLLWICKKELKSHYFIIFL